MGRQKGVIRLTGKIGDIEFYEKDGKGLVRMSNKVNKARIMNDPAYARTRENMNEFGAAAVNSKWIRESFAAVARQFGDKKLHNRLTSILRQLIGRSAGTRGRRDLDILLATDLIEGFEFHSSDHLPSKLYAPYTVAINADRNEVVWDIPSFNADNFVQAPQGATHFRLVHAIGTASKSIYNAGTGKYEPTVSTQASLGAVTRSGGFLLTGTTGAITLTTALPGLPVLDAEVGLINALGIEFYQEVNGMQYVLAQGNALRITNVF